MQEGPRDVWGFVGGHGKEAFACYLYIIQPSLSVLLGSKPVPALMGDSDLP